MLGLDKDARTLAGLGFVPVESEPALYKDVYVLYRRDPGSP